MDSTTLLIILVTIFIVCVIVIILVEVYLFSKTKNTGNLTVLTSEKLFGDQLEFQSLIQVRPSDIGDEYRAFNPTVTCINQNKNSELIYAYRVSNYTNLGQCSVRYQRDAVSYIALSNGKKHIEVKTDLIGGSSCAKGYEDPRIIVDEKAGSIYLLVNGRTGLFCKSEMWILELSLKKYKSLVRELNHESTYTSDSEIDMTRYNLIHDTAYVCETHMTPRRSIKLDIDFDQHKHQKNWMPFLDSGKLKMIYSVNPHIVLECDVSSGTCKKIAETYNPTIPKDLRGGSQILKYGNFWIGAIHRQDDCYNYTTKFYTFQDEYPYRVIGLSPDFKFKMKQDEIGIIQFVSGMYIIQKNEKTDLEKDILVITYGEHDYYSRECKIPMSSVLNSLENV